MEQVKYVANEKIEISLGGRYVLSSQNGGGGGEIKIMHVLLTKISKQD